MPDERVEGEIEMKKPEETFCLFCMGKGRVRETILLRDLVCMHCLGKGYSDDGDAEKYKAS